MKVIISNHQVYNNIYVPCKEEKDNRDFYTTHVTGCQMPNKHPPIFWLGRESWSSNSEEHTNGLNRSTKVQTLGAIC